MNTGNSRVQTDLWCDDSPLCEVDDYHTNTSWVTPEAMRLFTDDNLTCRPSGIEPGCDWTESIDPAIYCDDELQCESWDLGLGPALAGKIDPDLYSDDEPKIGDEWPLVFSEKSLALFTSDVIIDN